MKNKIYFILILLNMININVMAQNAQIDTVRNYKAYIEYINKSDSFVKLIAENKLKEALKMYNLTGGFLGRGQNIMKNLEDFHKLINLKNKKVFLIKSRLTLPKDDLIPSQSLEMLSILYTFPSKYKKLRNKIEIDYPLKIANRQYRFDVLFYKASDEYEMKKEIDALPSPTN